MISGATAAALSAAPMPVASAQSVAPSGPQPSDPSGSAKPSNNGQIIETRVAPRWVGPADGSGGASLLGEGELEPFMMIGATAPGLDAGGHVELRVQGVDGVWSPWHDVHSHGTAASDLVWVGSSTGYQVRGPYEPGQVSIHLARDRSGMPPMSGQELLEAQKRRPAATSALTPPIVPREAWGARPGIQIQYYDTIRVGFVHHTVNSNAYAPQDVPAILRSIQAYHMDVQGWWDIAYTFLADRYGTVWEGRGGGIDESFHGAHTKGFQKESFAIGNIGDFTSSEPTSAMLDANAEIMAWKLKRYGVDAAGMSTITTEGSGNELYPPDVQVTLRAISGHRDAQSTACPGDRLYRWLPWMRTEAHNRQWKYSVKPRATTAAATGPLARNSDGRLEVFGVGLDAELKHIWQWPASPSGWSGLASLGGSLPAKTVSSIANLDGRIEVFLAGSDGATHHIWQSPGSPTAWSSLVPIGGPAGSEPSAARNSDGRLEVFAVSNGGDLWHTWQVAPNSGWSDPSVLGSGFAAAPGIGTTLDSKLVVYGVTAGSSLRAAVQSSPNAYFNPWVTIGSGCKGRPVAGRNLDGRLEVFVLSTDNRLLHSFQSGLEMSQLYSVGSQTFSHPPAVTQNKDGRLEVFAVGSEGRLWHVYQLAPNSGWSGWEPLGSRTYAAPPWAIANADGRLEVFVLGTDNTMWHAFQVAPNSWWSDFYPLTGGLAA